MTARLALPALALMLAAGCSSQDYGQAICEAQLAQEDVCDTGNACAQAIVAASSGPCSAEVSAVQAAMPASYVECFQACPVGESCDVGGVTVTYRQCGCQTDCIEAAPADYRDAAADFASCMEADSAVSANCL